MNVFVLSTGRCGTETFARACQHMSNYTAAHESHSRWLHPKVKNPYRSLKFPPHHIEVDNRLSWFLGTLEKEYGPRAFYVHLLRRREEVAKSLTVRGEQSILFSFTSGILQYFTAAHQLSAEERYEIGLQYWDTVNDNIEAFLRDKPHQMTIWLHDLRSPYQKFWESIGAQGDLGAALAEWNIRHNATAPGKLIGSGSEIDSWAHQVRLAVNELSALIPQGESFILVDENQWGDVDIAPNRRAIPFLEQGSGYCGVPLDDDTAVKELDRLSRAGAGFIVFGWPAFWWLDYYGGLRQHLDSQFRCVLRNDRLIAFDLRSSKEMARAVTKMG
jgi:hypothetical protein